MASSPPAEKIPAELLPLDRKKRVALRFSVLLPMLCVICVSPAFSGRLWPIELDATIREKVRTSALATEREDARGASGYVYQTTSNSANEHYPPRIWIDVTSFAEGIGGWRTSLIELMNLARAINGTVVEPCMTDGRLGSCARNKIPVSEIFDLSRAMELSDGRPPLLASHDDYQKHRLLVAGGLFEHRICLATMQQKTRCSTASMRPGQVNWTKFRKDVANPNNTNILRLEDYWKLNSLSKIAKIFGIDNPSPMREIKRAKLSFHSNHVETVNGLLRRTNITDGDFSVVHFRAEKEGMDFVECTNAVVDAKYALLEKMPVDITDEREGGHPFLLMTSLNEDPKKMWAGSRRIAGEGANNIARQALDFLVKESGFLKIDSLIGQDSTVKDPGMLAVYDLILAAKSRNCATCAMDGGYGCNNRTRSLCDRCNHVGKFGKLALSMRSDLPRNSSWGCWPQTER